MTTTAMTASPVTAAAMTAPTTAMAALPTTGVGRLGGLWRALGLDRDRAGHRRIAALGRLDVAPRVEAGEHSVVVGGPWGRGGRAGVR